MADEIPPTGADPASDPPHDDPPPGDGASQTPDKDVINDREMPLLDHLADAHLKMPQAFEEDPVEVVRRNLYVMPFHEDSVARLVDTVGVDHIIFGSDFPHPEGLAEPCSYVDELPPGLPEADQAKIMGGNMARIMGVGVPA